MINNHSRTLFILGAISALSVMGYLIASDWLFRIGFPLDDAWIHQTYARNLALHAEWAFIPGKPSAGSTAPLWSALLAIGYWFNFGPYIWTTILGWLGLIALAVIGLRVFQALCPNRSTYAVWIGIFLCLEWHLVWAAVSGMETLFSALIILICLYLLIKGANNWYLIGFLIGLSVWVRPDGLTLVGPAVLVILLKEADWKNRFMGMLQLSLGIFIVALPYLIFNQSLSGKIWPNTFFAKQAEYSLQRNSPLLLRYIDQMRMPLIGVGALLLPGYLYFIYISLKRKTWGVISSFLWLMGYILLYAIRLPVTYQHGRYVMPAMPVYFVLSLVGMSFLVHPSTRSVVKRVVSRAWMFSTVVVLIVFWFLGARAYAWDVAIIESEMVDTALWISENTKSSDLIAAHDIGAIGYFSQREIIDLAGLISPEVIPFIRDEMKIEQFLDRKAVDYLVTFVGNEWYPELIRIREQIYITYGKFSPAMGGKNMAVFRWIIPED